MKQVRIDRYLDELETRGIVPRDVSDMLRGMKEYTTTMKTEGGRQKLTIRKGRDIAFMGYRNGRWEVPYGNLDIVHEIIEKLKR